MAMSRDPIAWLGLAREAVFFAIATGTGITMWIRRRSARQWPATFGKVESASNYQHDSTWLTDVSYSYTVAAEYYSGQFQLRDRSEKKSDAQVLRWKGQNISIRYSPTCPEISVVRMEDQAAWHGEEYRGH